MNNEELKTRVSAVNKMFLNDGWGYIEAEWFLEREKIIGLGKKAVEEGKTEDEIFFEKWSDEQYCLEAVKQDGYALMYVKEQTAEICMEAVKQNGNALMYVREQTAEICMEAVKQDSNALMYVREQTAEICMEAVKRNGYALRYVKERKIFDEIIKK